jgi:hypothetical protein
MALMPHSWATDCSTPAAAEAVAAQSKGAAEQRRDVMNGPLDGDSLTASACGELHWCAASIIQQFKHGMVRARQAKQHAQQWKGMQGGCCTACKKLLI